MANAEALPFRSRTFDALTIAFGIRNVTAYRAGPSEAYRVLSPGGRFLCLEFSRVDMPVIETLYDLYSLTTIPALGKIVTGDGQPYRYLVESIRRFPDAASFARNDARRPASRTWHFRNSDRRHCGDPFRLADVTPAKGARC